MEHTYASPHHVYAQTHYCMPHLPFREWVHFLRTALPPIEEKRHPPVHGVVAFEHTVAKLPRENKHAVRARDNYTAIFYGLRDAPLAFIVESLLHHNCRTQRGTARLLFGEVYYAGVNRMDHAPLPLEPLLVLVKVEAETRAWCVDLSPPLHTTPFHALENWHCYLLVNHLNGLLQATLGVRSASHNFPRSPEVGTLGHRRGIDGHFIENTGRQNV
mmetsp:Transcript_2085/g.7462  ORF Transcript_2085/g.7462 Transcript_2085/m.7462 type:complete len:216 (-) Transcript_2085:163-810(-)|eukprot:scaffold693_cov399-Prasinococcus_capsulatus_cf.AAC.8